ncbi:DUF2784 domain-containing protein [Antrihabitans sp. YC2-6]|uniref:DUF2784 domain-containing protein n=1 Tax=Antrihabitans sp. YC2-6 TaxID=2799498 RepID=UPI0018F5225E|nr:DUF2784 domain-containing protein [Antrihabitans sp. YC2-6]MBJ8345427.1 DUF2784 domain-containing protein [Antrihabitans sp. YC2-6]
MLYRLLADATVVVHLVFVGFVVVGGFLAWRWRALIFLHVPAVGWGFSAVLIGIECPLTDLENWARHHAGQAGLPSSGFIDHYLTGVIYPESALGLIRIAVATAVVTSWVGFAALTLRRTRVA